MADGGEGVVAAGPPAGAAPARPPATIVPLAGLPLVGIALVALVAGIASGELWALNFLHVVAGGLWTAIDLFVGFVVGPIIGRMPVPARVEFSARFMPKMLLLMPTLVVVTLAAGWELSQHLGLQSGYYPHHGWLVASYVVVGVMAVVAIGILEPANIAVLMELRKPQPDGALIGRLMKRFVVCAGITGVMQVLTLIIMSRLATL